MSSQSLRWTFRFATSSPGLKLYAPGILTWWPRCVLDDVSLNCHGGIGERNGDDPKTYYRADALSQETKGRKIRTTSPPNSTRSKGSSFYRVTGKSVNLMFQFVFLIPRLQTATFARNLSFWVHDERNFTRVLDRRMPLSGRMTAPQVHRTTFLLCHSLIRDLSAVCTITFSNIRVNCCGNQRTPRSMISPARQRGIGPPHLFMMVQERGCVNLRLPKTRSSSGQHCPPV